MRRRQRRWVRHGNTHILLELWQDNLVPEWRPVGYVMLRQVYTGVEQTWQVWWTEDGDVLVDSFPKVKSAKWRMECELDARRGYVEEIKEPEDA